jgi:DNA-3-methyladenine glycosylase I
MRRNEAPRVVKPAAEPLTRKASAPKKATDKKATDRVMELPSRTRCPWVRDELSSRYHDEEWGVPLHDDRRLFEFIVLEGAQAGLSWDTILRKRDRYREVFDNFDPELVARYDKRRLERLLKTPNIVRNRLKIASAVQNARALLKIKEEFESFDTYIWGFTGGTQKRNAWGTMKEVPAETPESVAMSKDLRKRGFNFVGATICYAFMQAVGMVNDHLVECFRYSQIS